MFQIRNCSVESVGCIVICKHSHSRDAFRDFQSHRSRPLCIFWASKPSPPQCALDDWVNPCFSWWWFAREKNTFPQTLQVLVQMVNASCLPGMVLVGAATNISVLRSTWWKSWVGVGSTSRNSVCLSVITSAFQDYVKPTNYTSLDRGCRQHWAWQWQWQRHTQRQIQRQNA